MGAATLLLFVVCTATNGLVFVFFILGIVFTAVLRMISYISIDAGVVTVVIIIIIAVAFAVLVLSLGCAFELRRLLLLLFRALSTELIFNIRFILQFFLLFFAQFLLFVAETQQSKRSLVFESALITAVTVPGFSTLRSLCFFCLLLRRVLLLLGGRYLLRLQQLNLFLPLLFQHIP